MTRDPDDLSDVYGAKTPDQSRALYNDWAQSYDADNLKRGFRLPSLGAGMFARHMGLTDGPVLDAACGTGLVGESLAIMGYGAILGCDLSPAMLAAARQTGAYHDLVEADMGEGVPFEDETFAGFTCLGAFGPGHAPPESLIHLSRVTRSGGIGVFNLLDATWKEQGFQSVLESLVDSGQVRIIQRSQPFLPFLLAEPDLWSRLYVIRRS
ncbi:Methyltransferase domain-containing protein [Roseovarius marisflavi]|uniref:Methyltransferase domain-containing protein n=1 Tax=Roseovarius marisflavi TaxID=1054996 RepID=A0A1M6ZTH0_9RHOB|nr:class I SAM-dependent methyltransferase [Roseovarius marisflavi]SHL33772.1 Methyltransferase domain-containing protein [Roseovarius marisflavi]